MSQNVHGTFISEKISKIRWRPDQFGNSHNFVSGSWDNEQNTVKLWKYISIDDEELYPYELKAYNTEGDVTEIKFINQDILIMSSSDGTLILLKIEDLESEAVDIKEQVVWKQAHKFNNGEPSSCTGFSIYEDDIATIGEDGRLNLLTARRETLVRTIENGDSCSLHCISFLKYNEVLTGNLRGQMKIWDLRQTDDAPTCTFMLNGDQHIAATCLCYHPTQRHMVLAGDEEGSITVWDLRFNTFPVTLLSAHSDAVREMQFHPSNPDHLFSCSNSGELWHWSTIQQPKHQKLMLLETEPQNPWFSNEKIKNKLEVFTLIPKLHKPINSLDAEKNKLLCGCDNEAIYLINNVRLT